MASVAGIKDIADAVGVSASTVSRVINGKSCVNEKTRQKVLAMLEQTRYQPNVVAQSLKMRRSNTICLMLPSIENLIFPAITRGVEDVARQNGFNVVLCNTDESDEMEQAYIDQMLNRWIDGFILCSGTNSSHARVLREQGCPSVTVNRFSKEDVDHIDIVSVDNFKSAYQAVQYLLRTGHRRIAMASGSDWLFLYRERLRGYQKALEDAGIPYDNRLVIREPIAPDNPLLYRMTQNIMGLENPPDAFFCASDPKAFVVLHALHDLNIRIPEDVSVLGFDNVSLSAMVEPPLSTMSQPLYEMGVAAAKSLLLQISYKEKHGTLPPPASTVMDVELVVRRSTI